MDVANEILDAIEIIVDKKIRENTAQIYLGICKSVNGNTCVMSVNGKNNTVQFYGSTPAVGSIYRVFVPDGNMSMAFAITGNDDRKGLHYSNPNLLDNWYFGNIIDQRNGWIIPPGLTAYSDSSLSTVYGKTTNYRPVVDIASNYVSFLTSDGLVKYVAPGSEIRGYTGTVYGPDRWKHGNNPTSILLVKDDALVVKIIDNYTSSSARTLHQKVDNVNQLFGKTVTASFLVDDISGSEFMVGYRASVGSNVLSKYIRVTTPGVYSATFQVQDGTTELLANVITDGSTKIDDYISIKAAKLELGSQQTLAHKDANGNWVLNEIPDYGEQLAKCQRYFQLYSAADNRPAKAVDCRPVMRTDPSQGTIVIGSTTYYYNTAEL